LDLPLRWQEVAVPLAVVLVLIALKYFPATAGLPLSRLAGIVSFGYAIFLALRLIQGEEAVYIDGWSELRPSPLELFGAFGGAAFSGLLLVAVLFGGALGGTPVQMVAAFCLSALLAVISGAITFQSLLVRVRWNTRVVERRDHKGRKVELNWADVVKVDGRWRGITITTATKQRLSFSPLHSGAAQLAKYARRQAVRNDAAIAKASTVWG
jgi:hypothetical protein